MCCSVSRMTDNLPDIFCPNLLFNTFMIKQTNMGKMPLQTADKLGVAEYTLSSQGFKSEGMVVSAKDIAVQKRYACSAKSLPAYTHLIFLLDCRCHRFADELHS